MTNEELQNLLREAIAAETQCKYDEAERLSQQILTSLFSLDLAEQADKEGIALQAGATRILGLVCYRRGDYPQALEHLHAALQANQQISDQAGIARALGNIGYIHNDLDDYPTALEYYDNALGIAEGLVDNAEVSRHLGNIGIVHMNLSDYPKALEYFGKALGIDEELGNKSGVVKHLGNIGNVHASISDYPKALEYYGKALGIAEELGNKSAVATYLGNIGLVHWNLSDYPKALEYYGKARGIAEELGNKSGVANWLGNIGNVHGSLGDYPKALEYYGKALGIAEELGNKRGVASWLGNIGVVHKELSDYAKALEYQSKALSLDEELGNKAGIATSLGNIGIVYEKQQSYERAHEYYLKALHLSEEIGATWPRLHWLLALGSLYAKQRQLSSDPNEAEKYLLLAITDSTTLGVRHITRDATEHCYLLYKEQERWQEALSMKELHESLKEQINIEETKKQDSIRQHQKEVELAQAAASAKLTATTSLLHRVLPAEIATRMIAGEEEIADYFTSVSILFADIAGFTPISADMPAIVVIRFLNYVFSEFDRIIKKHGCEKIKTIGDGYMAVCGAPIECADHAERLATAALEMQETITLPESIREYMPSGVKLGVRIGLHTGSVVAGVIGEERFVYDIYSDAVNTAARMESHGEENKIHVSNDFFRHLQNRFAMTKTTEHGFLFEKRGEMEIKGKGLMRTYFLEKA